MDEDSSIKEPFPLHTDFHLRQLNGEGIEHSCFYRRCSVHTVDQWLENGGGTFRVGSPGAQAQTALSYNTDSVT